MKTKNAINKHLEDAWMVIKGDEYTDREKSIMVGVYAIASVIGECRYWIENEESENYLTEENVRSGRACSFVHLPRLISYEVSEYASGFVEEAFRWSLDYDKYTGNIGDVVSSRVAWDGHESWKNFVKNPLKAVCNPTYSRWGYEFDEGELISGDRLIDFIHEVEGHDLDLDEVEKFFKIGEYCE